jgi:hypothetical protein
MGAAASSMGDTTSVSLDKAKELAGDIWSPSMEAKFNSCWEEKELLTIADLKRIAPTLFLTDDQNINLIKVKEITLAGGAEWNDTFQELFDNNKTTVNIEKTANGVTEALVESSAEPTGDTSADTTTESPTETNMDVISEEVVTFATWKGLLPSLFETPEEREVRKAAEYKAMLERRAEGNIIVNYQMYNEEFPISKNSLTAERINEDYGLWDVMPGCQIKLSTIESGRRTIYENENNGRPAPWVKEEPEGTYQELLAGETYYCIVIENPEQYKKDMAELSKRLEEVDKDTEAKPRQEGCSCLYGNPCQDPYVCLDWDNRWKVSIANGMTQAEIKRAGIMPG